MPKKKKRKVGEVPRQSKVGPIPGWEAGLIALTVVGVAAYLIIKGKKDANDKAQVAQDTDAVAIADAELEKLRNQTGEMPTYDDSTFSNFTIQLVGAISGCGTDEDAIYSVFQQMNNKADVLKLISVFGVQIYVPCFWSNPVDYELYEIGAKIFKGGLAAFLAFDLELSEMKKINDILAAKGIDYKF